MEWYWTGLLCVVVFIIGRWSGRATVDQEVNRAFFDGYELGQVASVKMQGQRGKVVTFNRAQ